MTTHRLAALGLSFAIMATPGLPGCADPGDDGATADTAGGSNLGIAGASCLRSADCESPLQCLDNVCRSVGAADTFVTDTSDALVLADTTPPDTALPDGYDVPEVPDTYDASGWEILEDTRDTTPEDTHVDAELFEGCEALGISEHWSGPFEGLIEFHVSDNPLTPSDGFLPVEGTLSFDIECIENKFVVKGSMDGTATIEGQAGSFPFLLKIQGYYSPLNRQMQAEMVEGSVNIYGLVEVYFEGTFLGELMEDGEFDGTWEGESTGTNQSFITGTADGAGIWGAAPL